MGLCGPPDRGAELELGILIKDLKSLGTERPLNLKSHLPINDRDLYCDYKKGFTSTRERMENGEHGIWAKFAAQSGIGGELSWTTERTANDTYNFKGFDTIYFEQDYLHRSMNHPDVKDFVVGFGYRPIYMVYGLKIARSPVVKMKTGRKRELKVDLGLNQPGGIQGLEVGPRIKTTVDIQDEMSFDESDDFIIGIQVKRLYYKRCYFLEASRASE
jgi:hypothetical protein